MSRDFHILNVCFAHVTRPPRSVMFLPLKGTHPKDLLAPELTRNRGHALLALREDANCRQTSPIESDSKFSSLLDPLHSIVSP
jgi:hypothetical protein